jgi:Carbohydrate-selective porin, OprB family/S-layer homology domain
MSNLLWKSLVVSPAVLGASLLVASTAIAAPSTTKPEEVVKTAEVSTTQPAPQILAQSKQTEVNVLDQVNRYSNEGKNGNTNSQGQVTSVSQFSDVQPTDWAFQALQSLVERYGCIAGYPNGTYRGNRALTRYEFAAGLNACLDRVNELIATATADLVTKEDLATLQRLQEEFGAELATLRGRVDALEARTAELEANQFSTTTKLQGEAIFALTDVFGDESGDANNTVFQDRVRLSLNTSFTGRDKLTTRLSAGNATDFTLKDRAGNSLTGDAEGRQTFNVSGGSKNNSVTIDRLTYEVPVGPAQLYVAAAGGKHSQYAAVNNPYFHDNTDGGNGALSTFASENPIYRIGGGAGAALNFPLGKGGGILKGSSVTVGYLANQAENPGASQGVFNGNYAALGQLNFSVGDRVALAATYVHGYHAAGSALFDADRKDGSVVGTAQGNAGNGLGLTGTTPGTISSPASSNSYGLSAAIRPSDKFSISGFVSYSDVNVQGGGNDFEAWSYGAGLALPDFGKKGNVLGIFGGRQPYANVRGLPSSDSYQIEGFYKYRVSDNISITPGVIYLTNPGQNEQNKDAVIGTLRTTFTF